MPPLLCPSPVMLDNTFPKSKEELDCVVDAFGELELCLKSDEAHVVLTETLRDMVDELPHESMMGLAITHEVIALLRQWFLQPHDRVIEIDLSDTPLRRAHPVPIGCGHDGLVVFWSSEVGRLFDLHNRLYRKDERPCIGILCEQAFSGGNTGAYDTTDDCFPLVAPAGVNDFRRKLKDAYCFDVDSNYGNRNVSPQQVIQNIKVLDGKYESPNGGSHCKVHFAGKRPWTFSNNDNPVPTRYLAQLRDLLNLPMNVIRFALSNGMMPTRRLRFPTK